MLPARYHLIGKLLRFSLVKAGVKDTAITAAQDLRLIRNICQRQIIPGYGGDLRIRLRADDISAGEICLTAAYRENEQTDYSQR